MGGRLRNAPEAVEVRVRFGKYPPAKPGALGLEPLKAVGRVADAARELGAA